LGAAKTVVEIVVFRTLLLKDWHMSKRNVHVVPNGNGWQVREAGRQTPVSNHRTQGAASDAGRRVAQRNEGELVIHRPNGRIRNSNSFGNDPNPPKDTKH
jgi:hypothetical protein